MHYFLLITGDNLEKQMHPYQELDMGLEDRKKDKRAIFIDETLELKDKYKEYKKGNQSFKNFCVEWNESTNGEKRSQWGRYDNPNRKWDYWGISDNKWWMLPLKSGKVVSKAFKREIDFRKLNSSYAILHQDQWIDQDELCPLDKYGNPDILNKKRDFKKERKLWKKIWRNKIKEIEPNTLITAIDYHC